MCSLPFVHNQYIFIDPSITLHGLAISPGPSGNFRESLDDPEPQPDNSHIALAVRRKWRKTQLPKRFRDNLPKAAPSLPPVPSALVHNSMILEAENQPTNPCRISTSCQNPFGLFCQYLAVDFPSFDPEAELKADDLSDFTKNNSAEQLLHAASNLEAYGPYPNGSSFALGEWFWNSNVQKSKEDFRHLVGIITDPAFKKEDILDTQWDRIDQLLGDSSELEWVDELDAGWARTPVTIQVPFPYKINKQNCNCPNLAEPQDFTIEEFYHCSIVLVLKERLNSPDAWNFHMEPYKLYWQPGKSQNPTRVQGELYTSPAFINSHNTLQESPGEPVNIFWTSQNMATVHEFWQQFKISMIKAFASSMQSCCILSEGFTTLFPHNICSHVPQLPDNFKDFVMKHSGATGLGSAFMVHCQRELIHAQWKIIMDDDFMDAYIHGIVHVCPDGLSRRFYLWLFTYSADYPEKILIASIRNLGSCPCPRCEIELSKVHNMGMPLDRKQQITKARYDDASRRAKVSSARDLIYEQGHLVNSAHVERLLKPKSLVPTANAFSERLASLNFNMFLIFVVDILHEIEIGVWRSLYIHLIQILNCGNGLSHDLDKHYQAIPTFGKDAIRKFSSNCSEMKRLAAQDFEDLLQCAIPVFDGLLQEPHNSRLLDLLFVMAHWRGLAKLHMHTDSTLAILDQTTTMLGQLLRDFHTKTCLSFDTKELPRKANARDRCTRQTKQKSTSTAETSAVEPEDFTTSAHLPGTIRPITNNTLTFTSYQAWV
ncbi:hypothetical protein BDZ94DRAFT_1313287 [Collybia nuda]|uniref:Transposase n=1 Tax=Collybia nuda TaxID=64659 RepID=A0A9P6CEW6_9AGAR|nr:hypothetical protein BDZ94DRAFT_1313287 [Collybia nuda]